MAAGENRNGNDEIELLIDCVKCRFICVPFPAPHPALVCPAPRPLGVAAYYSEENMLLKARQKKRTLPAGVESKKHIKNEKSFIYRLINRL